MECQVWIKLLKIRKVKFALTRENSCENSERLRFKNNFSPSSTTKINETEYVKSVVVRERSAFSAASSSVKNKQTKKEKRENKRKKEKKNRSSGKIKRDLGNITVAGIRHRRNEIPRRNFDHATERGLSSVASRLHRQSQYLVDALASSCASAGMRELRYTLESNMALTRTLCPIKCRRCINSCSSLVTVIAGCAIVCVRSLFCPNANFCMKTASAFVGLRLIGETLRLPVNPARTLEKFHRVPCKRFPGEEHGKNTGLLSLIKVKFRIKGRNRKDKDTGVCFLTVRKLLWILLILFCFSARVVFSS